MTLIDQANAPTDDELIRPSPQNVLVRAMRPGLEIRAAADGGMPTMFGHFAVFNRWTEIDSLWEGQFMERIAPGAFKRTFQNNRSSMRVTLNHGQDPTFGDKPLGTIEELSEDATGAYYEVALLDTSYNRDLVPGLEAGLYGASFRFRVMKEQFDQKPGVSADNPAGLPLRTIQEAQVMEFGPVTFPAYADATASIRSLTDDFIVRQLQSDPERLRRLLEQYVPAAIPAAPVAVALPPGPDASHSEAGTRETPVVPVQPRFKSKEEYLKWLSTESR